MPMAPTRRSPSRPCNWSAISDHFETPRSPSPNTVPARPVREPPLRQTD